MSPIIEAAAEALRALAPPGTRVIAAVSGGPDSVALVYLLHDLQRAGGFSLAGLAHLNHQLRGADADADEAFCRDLAACLVVPFVCESHDVAAAARDWRTSIEDAGRRLRYEFLERARQELDADVVAIAHTRDDQAETFLLRLIRGAGARGLGGMRARRGAIIRPLLHVGRADLHAWLAGLNVPFRVDATNADVAFPRNRVRHEVLPAMERVSRSAIVSVARAAHLAAADEDFLCARAIEVAPSLVLSHEGGALRLDLGGLKALHQAVGDRVLRDALAKVAPGRFIALRHIEALRRLESGSLDLPSVTATVDSGSLTLTRAAGRRTRAGRETNVFRYPLSIPGEASIQESGVSISAEIVIGRGVRAETTDGVVVAAATLEPDSSLFVRNRRPGDRWRPFGMTGTKKLQDYLVDRKVPRSDRDRVPLVVDGRDRIVWVVGHAVAEDFRVTDPNGAVLLLKVRHLGERVELDS